MKENGQVSDRSGKIGKGMGVLAGESHSHMGAAPGEVAPRVCRRSWSQNKAQGRVSERGELFI